MDAKQLEDLIDATLLNPKVFADEFNQFLLTASKEQIKLFNDNMDIMVDCIIFAFGAWLAGGYKYSAEQLAAFGIFIPELRHALLNGKIILPQDFN